MQISQSQGGAVSKAAPVSRKMTMAGGFEVDTGSMPQLQSGKTSAGGVVPEQAEDPAAEARSEALALIVRLTEVLGDLADGRYVTAAEAMRGARRQVDSIQGYAQHLARAQCRPFLCPRCVTARTHDPKGESFCAPCVSATYGKARL